MAYRNTVKNIDLLLIGKSGHGKSCTGNSILGRRNFKVQGGGTSITKDCRIGYTESEEHAIKVVDIPGVCDTDCTSEEECADLVAGEIATALKKFPFGFNALLLILSYTERITQEQKAAINALKHILGKNVLKEHAICVFTHGDSFSFDFEGKMDFKEWCRGQKDYRDLFEECNWRCVIFNNLTRDDAEKAQQLEQLLSVVRQKKESRYTNEDFMIAENAREEEKRVALLLDKFSREGGLIKDSMNKIMLCPSEERFVRLEKLKTRVSVFLTDVEKEKHEGLDNMKKELEDIVATITSYEGYFKQQEQERFERKRLVESLDTMRKDHKAQMEDIKRDEAKKDKEFYAKMKKMDETLSIQANNMEKVIDKKRDKEDGGNIKETILKGIIEFVPIVMSLVTSINNARKK